jgi:hypothetical protein
MLKKHIALPGIILFAASLFPFNALAADPAPNNAPVKNCIKVTDQSKADQVNPASDKKPAKRKG